MLSPSKGFTLLEVMIALAIMAGVVLTVLTSVNYHLSIISAERDNTALTLLARAKITELEQGALQEKSEGTLAPMHPEFTWKSELLPTQLPALKKLVLRVQRTGDKREVALVRYIVPK
ncbi:prepilin-type N-terminal cleavage/methylation domain-containing protein [Geobacter chapellei]|uniref:Prepilin-type N-terminal cleavage/methylation domain-containing protein n=2 Tax=Pelotalea chapellei TaxID=44671 RepID=A0ABS5U500_9BACT|nr:prepilin-type N-terminal cleavage/methylation domain-containing protein [Pelotalea chapellei]